MKAQISLFVTSLAFLPLSLSAQPSPPFLSGANYSPVEQTAIDALPAPPDPVAESAPCTAEPVFTFKADSNETNSDISERYTRARQLVRKGAWRQAQLVLKNSIEKFPESRHLRMVYADLLWHLSERGKDRALLEQSSQQAIRAMEIGLDLSVVDQRLVSLLSDVLSRTGDAENFERLFARALALDSEPNTHRRYAVGLSRMNSSRTEDAFKAATALESEGSAHADYGEWLLDRGRYADALTVLPQEPNLYYLNFLRGVALEHTDRPGSARKAYERFRAYSKVFPAPARFRIKESKAQRGIRFDDEPGDTTASTKALTNNDAIYGISYMLYGEAVGENYGGKLAVGWVARARVHRGTLQTTPNPCPFATDPNYLPDAYKAVMCQSGAFDGACDAWCANPTAVCSWNQDTQDAAYDVYYGYKVDPVSGHCPGGIYAQGDPCAKEPRRTCIGNLYSYRYSSPLFQLSVPSGTTCQIQQSCAPHVYDKVCGNGGYDHCFSGNNNCIGVGMIRSSATLSTPGAAAVTTPYYVSSSFTHKGHLEAPEGSNFNAYLQHSYTNNGTDWADYYSNPQPGATEDITVTTNFQGYFRWRVVASQGTGFFNLCSKRSS
jgi:tetratricopeptide (TPR) repeat protein